MQPHLKVGIIGLGSRGATYMRDRELYETDLDLVAIADVNRAKVAEFGREYHVPESGWFYSDEELFKAHPDLDIIYICTQDRFHFKETMKALELGYHVLLEKPAGVNAKECRALLKIANETGKLVALGHVLRFAPGFVKLKELLDAGEIGELRTVQAIEQISYHHHAHSFVRGNCGRTDLSSCLFLQKCSHDMDLVTWLTGRHAVRVSSYANQSHFIPENAPDGAPKRCSDGCPAGDSCPFNAVTQYYTEGTLAGKDGWPYEMVVPVDYSPENMLKALQEGPYGRCVYFAGADAVDHQVVNIEMEDKLLVNFTMSTFTPKNGRIYHFLGTLGEIAADMDDAQTLTIRKWNGEENVIRIAELCDNLTGHGGGDALLLRALVDAVRGNISPNLPLLQNTIESHYICLKAEESRLSNGKSVSVNYPG